MPDPLSLENHWLTCMASVRGGRLSRIIGGLVVANSDFGGAAFNFITLRSVATDCLEGALEAGQALLAEHGRPPVVYLSPLAGDTAALGEQLEHLGWRRRLRQVVLARGTAHLPTHSPHPALTLSTSELKVWGATLIQAYEIEPRAGRELAAAWSSLSQGDGIATYYLAHMEGKPVGTGLLWRQGGLAGLYCGAVLPAFRRRGVERATLVQRLHDAAADAHTALLQTEAGSPVEHLCVQRLGFDPAYAREIWLPANSAHTL